LFIDCECKKSFSTNPLGIKMEFEGGSEIHYRGNVAKSDAEELGEYLKEVGYFNDENPVSVQLLGDDDALKVRFVVKEKVFSDKQTINRWQKFARDIKIKLYNDEKIEVHLCDMNFKTKEVVYSDIRTIKYEEEKEGRRGHQ
jgi:preprotein translocase subunit SecF